MPSAIVQIHKFFWTVTSYGGCAIANVFAQHYDLHYKNKKVHLEGCETIVSTQFGCIAFHPSRYGGQPRLTPTVRNKWTTDWASNYFYCKVPSEQVADVQGKENYPLRSMMTQLNHWTDAPFECGPGDVDVVAFVEVELIIGGHGAVEEYLACGVLPLKEGWEFAVERRETPLSKVGVPVQKDTPIIGKQESKATFKGRIVAATNLLVGNYCVPEHYSYTEHTQSCVRASRCALSASSRVYCVCI
jgi:hypothetical protein